MLIHSNGRWKKLTDILVLNYSSSKILEGFRKNSGFLKQHYSTLNMLSESDWRVNKFMNTENHISSPNRLILNRYLCNLLAALLVDISENKIKKIVINCRTLESLDRISRLIFSILEAITQITIEYEYIRTSPVNEILTPEAMRIQVKRGLYDKFSIENNDSRLMDIYNYFESVFLGKFYNVDQLVELFSHTQSNYEKWILIKSIINQGIRQNRQEIVEYFLQELEKNNQGQFDFMNSYSFYLLKFFSKHHAQVYLEKRIDIEHFLNSESLDQAESLVFKNYSTLLTEKSFLKKSIMEKCLKRTPQDVDLWQAWFKDFASEDEIKIKSTEIYNSGYSDLSLLPFLTIHQEEQETLVRTIILLSTEANCGIAERLTRHIANHHLKIYMENFINLYRFNLLLEGEYYEKNF